MQRKTWVHDEQAGGRFCGRNMEGELGGWGGPARCEKYPEVHVELKDPGRDCGLGEDGRLHEAGVAAPRDYGDESCA
jgi:hypothetical protein